MLELEASYFPVFFIQIVAPFRAELVTPHFQGMVWDHRPGYRESGETNHRGRQSGGRAEKIEEKSPFHRCPSPHGRCQSASNKSSTPASEKILYTPARRIVEPGLCSLALFAQGRRPTRMHGCENHNSWRQRRTPGLDNYLCLLS